MQPLSPPASSNLQVFDVALHCLKLSLYRVPEKKVIIVSFEKYMMEDGRLGTHKDPNITHASLNLT